MSQQLGKCSGIYCIENTENQKVYIGSSYNMRGRIYGHLWHLDNNSHINSHLQSSYNKHGGENFIIFELERCEESVLIEREQLYFDTFLYAKEYIQSDGRDERFHHYGYNLTPTAGKTIGFKHTEEDIEQMVIQGKLNWKNEKYRKAQEFYYDERYLSMLQGKLDDSTYLYRLSESLKNSECRKKLKKPVIAYNRITGEFIGEFDSIKKTGEELNVNTDRIFSVLKKKVKYSHDMYFEYKVSNIYPLKIEPILQYNDMESRKKSMSKIHVKNRIPVLAYKVSGEFVGEFESQIHVHKELKTHPGAVLQGICSQLNGYTFKYKDPNYVSKKRKPYKTAKRVLSSMENS